ncbi:MAG TPA: glycosyltransferase family 2 protein [Anaeromyxobacteraceae bacterium]|nr:glycosyltransferase family 2 protein [Anaeromyxobacteraceae bacterium]
MRSESGTPRGARPQISVVIPLYNEEGNVDPLVGELYPVLEKLELSFEVICVDDGSSDGTFAALSRQASRNPGMRVIRFRRNFGQTAAMSAGIEAARGRIIVPMDADLQNDPSDIARLLVELERGHDVVSGWRKERKDLEFGRKLPSRMANLLISAVSGVRLHDYGCSLKAYRREVLEGVRLYGEMHRFIPIYASWQGARVSELVVNHRPRRSGRSKYGLGRTLKVLLDLLVVKFLASYLTRPIYLFGGAGLSAFLCALVALALALFYKLTGRKDLVATPLPLLAVAFALAGVVCLLMGLLAELVIRTYYESQGKRPYLIAEEVPAAERAAGLAEGSMDAEAGRGGPG